MLGINWVPDRGVFIFKLDVLATSDIIAECSVLSEIMQLSNPLAHKKIILIVIFVPGKPYKNICKDA